ncbi:MAG: hypothetical protein IJG83_03145, partial [Thermoguttaceae bacterium]|nr:hypothetical protein [Thermoguttaceae bacterium]
TLKQKLQSVTESERLKSLLGRVPGLEGKSMEEIAETLQQKLQGAKDSDLIKSLRSRCPGGLASRGTDAPQADEDDPDGPLLDADFLKFLTGEAIEEDPQDPDGPEPDGPKDDTKNA